MEKIIEIRLLLSNAPVGASSVIDIEIPFQAGSSLRDVKKVLDDKYGKIGWCGFTVLGVRNAICDHFRDLTKMI